MKILDLTFPTPEENLACDEALLEACEAGSSGKILRFWESSRIFAVVGYSNRVADEIQTEACQKDKVTILRRVSGGGTVLQGSGCLNYSLLLPIKNEDFGNTISDANHFIMNRQAEALSRLLRQEVHVQGDTDLAIGSLKFSGNAQRRKNQYLLFHGTFLLNFDLSLIERYLKMPPKQPAYREGRPHGEFVMNLNVPASSVKEALVSAWKAEGALKEAPKDKIQSLVQNIYSKPEWNYKF